MEKKMEIKKVMVLGQGQMGNGIVQVAAQGGYDVILYGRNDERVAAAVAGIAKNLQRSVDKERITAADKDAILSRITTTNTLEPAKDADLVVEAVSENIELKEKLFRELDEICPPDTILSTNTSSLPITQIAAFTNRPDKVIGMHFFNPVPVMKLVEIIRGIATGDETYKIIEEASIKMGKNPVEVNDSPGFVSNRVLMPMINEAIFCLFEGVATPEAIDDVMKGGMNHPMGPLALADLIGLDTCLSILGVLYDGFKDSKYRPCPLLKKYVDAGWLGKKVGRGFYTY
jgi:3-hydroxybutyryl-CoA dehydrogenase